MDTTPELLPIKPEDLFQLKSIHDARLSPDGKRIVYALSWVEIDKNEEYANLWLLALDSGEARRLTTGDQRDSSPAWSPDGKSLAFLSTRSGKTQIHLIPVDGGEAQKLTDLKQGVAGEPVWSPDGKSIAFSASKPHEEEKEGKPYRITRAIYRFNDAGYLRQVLQDIYTISLKSGEVQQLTDEEWNNYAPRWSPDGKEILFLSCWDPDSFSTHARLKIINLQGQVRPGNGEWGNVMQAQWLPDGEHIAFLGLPENSLLGTKSDLWVIDMESNVITCRTPDLPIGVGGDLQGDFPAVEFQGRLCISGDGEDAFVRVQNGGALGIYRVALKGEEEWEPLVTGERLAALMDANRETLLYMVSSMHATADLYISDSRGQHERRLTYVNQGYASTWHLPEVEHLLFPSQDDTQIEGWLMKPPTGKPPYPTVLYIHGGPNGAFGSVFAFDFHMLAGAGYAVLFINPRGSSGYGSDFATVIKGDWGNLDYQDLMAGVDHVIEQGLADPQRLGVTGLSYGGYMSSWIVGHTDRFKAAVPENPVINLVSLYGTGDISPDVLAVAMGGKPHEIPEVYRKCSPITYAQDCTTPTLLIQGESDYRCPAEQSEQFYTSLQASGCVVEMLRLPGGSHVGSITGAPVLRLAQNQALLDWMDRYVRNKTSKDG
jgi:dipeptidyl aminopeptidase/acylaminoacyl peptidase